MNTINVKNVIDKMNHRYQRTGTDIQVRYSERDRTFQVDTMDASGVLTISLEILLLERLPRRIQRAFPDQEPDFTRVLQEDEYAALISEEIEEQLERTMSQNGGQTHENEQVELDVSMIFPVVIDTDIIQTGEDEGRERIHQYPIIISDEESHRIAFYHPYYKRGRMEGKLIRLSDEPALESDGLNMKNIMAQAMSNVVQQHISLPDPIIQKRLSGLEMLKVAVYKNTEQVNVAGIMPFPTLVSRYLNTEEYLVDYINHNYIMIFYSEEGISLYPTEALIDGFKSIQQTIYQELIDQNRINEDAERNEKIYYMSFNRPPELIYR